MNEVPADFAFQESASLESIESGMRAVESNIKFALPYHRVIFDNACFEI